MVRTTSVSAVGLLIVLFLTLFPLPTTMATPGIWIAPRSIDNIAGDVQDPDVAIDSSGNTLATWTTLDSATGRRIILASRYEMGLGWTEPQPIGMMEAPWNGGRPQAAVSSQGVSVVVWRDTSEIWANYHIPGFGWGGTVPLWGDGGDTAWWYDELRVAAAPTGQFVVVWFGGRSEGQGVGIWASSFLPGVGWAQPAMVPIPRPHIWPNEDSRMMVLDGAGNAFVAWQDEGRLGVSRFLPGTGWDSPAYLEGGGLVDIAAYPSGEALVAYSRGGKLWAAKFDPSLGWASPTEVTSTGTNLQIAINEKGDAMAVFCDLADGRIWVRRYVPKVGWGDAASLETNIPGGSYWFRCRPALGFDPSGHGIIVWEERVDGDNRTLHASRVLADGTLSAQTSLSDPHTAVYRFRRGYAPPQIAVNPSGSIAIVWAQAVWGDWTWELWASLFVPVPELDVTPPTLTLTSPKDGFATASPIVTVAGWTEPGANLVVNGLRVEVAPEGSFSFPLALSEGTNTITATATDAAGNSVSIRIRATYANPLPGLEGQLQDSNDALESALEVLRATDGRVLLLLIPQAALAFATAVLLILYWNQRRGGSGGRGNTVRTRSLLPAQGQSVEDRDARKAPKTTNRRSGAVHYQPWPDDAEAGSALHVTAKERVILHLLEFAKHESVRDVPAELTQDGIADAAGFDRRHFAQYIRPLLQEGLVHEGIAYVRGGLRRRKVYGLTEVGVRMAFGLRERIQSTVVQVKDGTLLQEAPIREVVARSPRSQTLLNILREAIHTGLVNLGS